MTGTPVFPANFVWYAKVETGDLSEKPSERTEKSKLNGSFGKDECEAIFMMYDKLRTYEYVVDACENDAMSVKISEALGNKLPDGANVAKIQMDASTGNVSLNGNWICNLPAGVTIEDWERYKSKCLFKPLAAGFSVADNTNRPLCNHDGQCQTIDQTKFHMRKIQSFLNEISNVIPEDVKEPEKKISDAGKATAITAGVTVGAGGLATAITAFVEKNNINCRVGDGLNTVAYGKTHTIDSLKDFYTKWNLRLPDRIMPSTPVDDVPSLTTACAEFNSKLASCADVQVLYKYTVDNEAKTQVISSACEIKDNKCVPNQSIITLYKIKNVDLVPGSFSGSFSTKMSAVKK